MSTKFLLLFKNYIGLYKLYFVVYIYQCESVDYYCTTLASAATMSIVSF